MLIMKKRNVENISKSELLSDLISSLGKGGFLKTPKVKQIFLAVDRSKYVLPQHEDLAFDDRPLPIGYHVTISAPHMHATALEYLKDHLKPGSKCLDVGSGSGIVCSYFMRMLEFSGMVVGIEHIEELTMRSYESIVADLHSVLEKKTFEVTALINEADPVIDDFKKKSLTPGQLLLVTGDGRKGFPQLGPFNCIHVGAAIGLEHTILLDQLANNGRMMAPVTGEFGHQEIIIFDKDAKGKVSQQKVLDVRYVPLTSKQKQLRGY